MNINAINWVSSYSLIALMLSGSIIFEKNQGPGKIFL